MNLTNLGDAMFCELSKIPQNHLKFLESFDDIYVGKDIPRIENIKNIRGELKW